MSNKKDGADKAAPIGKDGKVFADGKAPADGKVLADEKQGVPGQDGAVTAVTGSTGENGVALSAPIVLPGPEQGSVFGVDWAARPDTFSVSGVNDSLSGAAAIVPNELPQNPPSEPGLRIASRSPDGFRRAGRRFGPEPVDIAMSDLSDGEIMQLRKEGCVGGMLVVMEVTMPMRQPDMDDEK